MGQQRVPSLGGHVLAEECSRKDPEREREKEDGAVGNARNNLFYFTVLLRAVTEPVSVNGRAEVRSPKRIPLA